MPVYHDEGVVLRTQDLGEADRIVTILTASHGKVRAVARGVRREKSRFGARLEPFMRSDLLIATGRSLDVVSQAAVIAPYARAICTDYNAYLAASAIAQTADKLHADPQHNTAWRSVGPGTAMPDGQYRLLVGALAALARRLHTPLTIAYSYVLRAMAQAGWLPRLGSCVVCGQGDCAYFSVQGGGSMCAVHQLPGSHGVSPAEVRQLQALLDGDWAYLDGGERARESTGGTPIPDPAPATAPVVSDAVSAIIEEWSEYY
ncbi:MAG: DNA repair protein RecO, partial [Bifidobacteriaceae bacterium]|nr:DNA repair protein RecO [Bifidobacteriaceae bacterium]